MASKLSAWLDPHGSIWSDAVQEALGNQSDKVLQTFAQGCGWEAWAQVGISLALEHTLKRSPLYAIRQLELGREEATYEGTSQRCDLRATLRWDKPAESIWQYFVELKRMSGRGLNYFIGEVRKDLEKVSSVLRPKDKRAGNAQFVAGEVIAITVNPFMTPRVRAELLHHLQAPRLIPRPCRPCRDDREHKVIQALEREESIFDRMYSQVLQKKVRCTIQMTSSQTELAGGRSRNSGLYFIESGTKMKSK